MSPPSFNMLSFVDATGDEAVIWLVSGHASENKSAPKLGGQSSTSDLKSQTTNTSRSKVPNKVIKQSPPILDAKLRLLCEVGKYPAERSVDLCHTLTARDAMVQFSSVLEQFSVNQNWNHSEK